MSIRLMAQIWDNGDGELHGSRLNILLCLADHANDSGECWPSIDRIAARARIERRNVMGHLQDLEELGYLRIVRSPGRVNRYQVQGTRDAGITGAEIITSDARITPTRDTSITPTRDTSITPPVIPASPEPSENHNTETKEEPSNGAAPRGKARAKKEPASTPEQVQWYRSVIGRYPPKALFDRVVEVVDLRRDEALLKRCYQTWVAKGWNPNNLNGWLFEWYANGEIPANRAGNGRHADRQPDDYESLKKRYVPASLEDLIEH